MKNMMQSSPRIEFMNAPLEKLTNSLTKPVTRRQAFKAFTVGLAEMALARFGPREAKAITLGQLDGEAHPNVGGVVWLVSPRPPVPAPMVLGSGTLIHPRVYLTAGHVTYAMESFIAQGTMTLDDLFVSFASNAANPNTRRAISGVLTHPGYLANISNGADVGVLVLENPATGISPVPLPPVGFLDALKAAGDLKAGSNRARFTVVGYGIDPADANYGHLPFPPDGLRRVAQPEFQNLHDQWLYSDQNDSHDNGGSASGDSGGPLFWVDAVSGEETLVAVVSRGSLTSAHDCRVDTAEVLDFLNDVIEMVEAGEL